MDKPKIVIWGPDNHNTLGLLRQLSVFEYDIFILINGHSSNCVNKSKYCHSIEYTKNYQIGLDFLLSNFKSNDTKIILIATGDRAAEMIDRNRVLLNNSFYLMGTSEPGLLERVDNKNYMMELATQCGFTVPKSMPFNSNSQVEIVPVPCILKPTSNTGLRDFKTKVFYSHSSLKNFQKYLNPEFDYNLQELIHKTNDIVLYGCRMQDGKVLIAGLYYKDRWSDDGGGSHGWLTGNLPSYISIEPIEKLLNNIDYKGLFSTEYGLMDGKAYFYEINLRNDATSHLFYQAGANLPLAWVNEYLGIKTNSPVRIENNVWNINEIYDIVNVIRGHISYKEYKRNLKEATAFYFFDENDKLPWRYAKMKSLWDIPFRALLKQSRPYIVWILNKIKVLISKSQMGGVTH